ncbi:MAG: hypothetical protein QNK83_01715 [Akkermansiaceae bacterium]
MSHLTRARLIRYAPWIGILILVIGFLYSTIFTGIPDQDPTPQMVADFQRHSKIAEVIHTSGIITLFAGFILRVALKLTGSRASNS